MTNLINNMSDFAEEPSEEEIQFNEDHKMSRLQFEHEVHEAEQTIKAAEAALRLFHNEDFKLLIIDGYFREEPIRLAGMLASDKLADDHNRRIITEDIMAIGKLKNMLSKLSQQGPTAQIKLEELREHRNKFGLRGE